MDIYEEHLVERKRTIGDYLSVLGIFLGIFVALIVLSALFQMQASLLVVVVAGGIYLMYLRLMHINMEYEYCFTNGMMDVDQIIGKKKRKHMGELNARKIEEMALLASEKGIAYLQDKNIKKIYACTHMEDEGVYYILFEGKKGRTLLLFNPNDAILEAFHKYNPKRVFLHD